ncbi:CBS domain-containing protein CBSX3 [Hibiscus syriacus]|uniref:CBS domain-containing protein CBSX3 n=1 Tax=Hibiscus syriacus TaxID=106335 RepID=A0A6A2XGF0_HIBSY|nr:CBS domain-containing protein CBSX3 [Hibiscus syriacus]
MQGLIQGLRSCWQERIKVAIIRHSGGTSSSKTMMSSQSMEMEEKGLENMTVADVLMTKGEATVGSWISCRINDNVDDAMKNVSTMHPLQLPPSALLWNIVIKRKQVLQMAQHNIGSLVVLKPGDQQHIAGIITERDYLRKIIGQGRSPKYTRVGEIMTNEVFSLFPNTFFSLLVFLLPLDLAFVKQEKLITVKSDTSILQAMQLMTDNHIRHVPVIDGRLVGMVSIVDVVRAVVEQQNGELNRLNSFIKGDYY